MANVNFGYIITQDAAIVPHSIDLGNGLIALDASGTLAPEILPIDGDNGIYLLSLNGATLAQYATAAKAFAKDRGYVPTGAAGGITAQADMPAVAPTPGVLAPGTWTPT